MPGKIHVSQTVADELERHGHSQWLEKRQDKIIAKGKGEMTTYFIIGSSLNSQGGSVRSSELSDFDDSTARPQGFVEATDYVDTATRSGTGPMLAADMEHNEDDDALMLDIHEKLQRRVEQRKSLG